MVVTVFLYKFIRSLLDKPKSVTLEWLKFRGEFVHDQKGDAILSVALVADVIIFSKKCEKQNPNCVTTYVSFRTVNDRMFGKISSTTTFSKMIQIISLGCDYHCSKQSC